MCRLWGISYGPGGPESEDWTPSELAQIMFPALVRGGPHAWGWMSWDGEEVSTTKYPGRCDTPEAMSLMDLDPNAKWIAAHTRMATHGSPEDMRNNHPIKHGKFLGMHNGVLRNHQAILNITGREDPKTEVDSEAIFAAVDHWGHRKGLSKIYGDMVAVYTNLEKSTRTVHIARSSGRPLVFAKTKAGSLIWASEEQAIEATGLEIIGKMNHLGTNRLMRVREGKVVEKTTFKATPEPALPTRTNGQKKGSYSVSGTRSAMMRAGRREYEEAESFIARERSKTRVRATTRKAAVAIDDPVAVVKARKADPDWGLLSDDGKRYWVGTGWIAEREFISMVMDELGWH